MANLTWEWTFTALGHNDTLTVVTSDTPSGGPYSAVSISGTVDGSNVTALGTFEGGDNTIGNGGIYLDGVDGSGLSFVTAAGTQYNFFRNGSAITLDTSNVQNNAVTNIVFTPACYAAGTFIRTPSGDVAVECLGVGDEVVTASGQLRPVIWVGHRHVDLERHADLLSVMPVVIRAGAFGSLPMRDLAVSPEHCIYAQGVLVPAKDLINDITIVQPSRSVVTYWHVELDRHDVILAEGLPAESFLENGNRSDFLGGAVVNAHPSFAGSDMDGSPCAPVRRQGPEVQAIRAELARHARFDLPAIASAA